MRRTSEILKEFRKTRGMTAAMMAEKLGISTVTMSAIDVGRKKLSEQMLEKLETILPKDDFIDLLKSEREMNLPSFLLKKFEKYNIQSEYITNISEISEEGKRKIYDFIELIKISERARNNRETVNISNLSTENKEKAREYIELLEIKQEKK